MELEDAPRALLLLPFALVAALAVGVLAARPLPSGVGASVAALVVYLVAFGSRLDRRLLALTGALGLVGLGAVYALGSATVPWLPRVAPDATTVGVALVALGAVALVVRASLRWAGAVGDAQHRDYGDARGGELLYYVVATAVVFLAAVAVEAVGRGRRWDLTFVAAFGLSLAAYAGAAVAGVAGTTVAGPLVLAVTGVAATFALADWQVFDDRPQPTVGLFLAAAAREGLDGLLAVPRAVAGRIATPSGVGDPSPAGGPEPPDGASGTRTTDGGESAVPDGLTAPVAVLRVPFDLAAATVTVLNAATGRDTSTRGSRSRPAGATAADGGTTRRSHTGVSASPSRSQEVRQTQEPGDGSDGPVACQNCGTRGVEAGVRRHRVVPDAEFEVTLCGDCGDARRDHGGTESCAPVAHGIDADRIRERDDRQCRACGTPEQTPIGPPLAVHEIVPVAATGYRHDRNVVSLCRDCHAAAHDA